MSEILNDLTSRCSSTNIPSIITFFPGATQQVLSDLYARACTMDDKWQEQQQLQELDHNYSYSIKYLMYIHLFRHSKSWLWLNTRGISCPLFAIKNTFELAHSKPRSMRNNNVSRIKCAVSRAPGFQICFTVCVPGMSVKTVCKGCPHISIRKQLLARRFCVYSACKR